MRSWKVIASGGLALVFAYASLSSSTSVSAAGSTVPCAPDAESTATESTVRVATRAANTLTHLERLRLAPEETDARTVLESTTTLRAQVFAELRTVDEQVAAQVLAAVEAQEGVRLAPAGSVTAADDVAVAHPRLGNPERDSYYAVFAGHRAWQGTYALLSRCPQNPAWQVTAEGTWSSFEPTRQTGAALCTLGLKQYRSSYVKASLPFRACARTWW